MAGQVTSLPTVYQQERPATLCYMYMYITSASHILTLLSTYIQSNDQLHHAACILHLQLTATHLQLAPTVHYDEMAQ